VRGVDLLRMRCDRFRRGSPTLVFRLYFSLASLCHLPFRNWGVGLNKGGREVFSQVMVMVRVGEWEEIARSTYLMISLCSTTRFNSFTTRGPTHTVGWTDGWMSGEGGGILGKGAVGRWCTHSLCG
jgi:hypothetical protein